MDGEYGGGGEEYRGEGEEYTGGGDEYRGGGITFTLKTDHEEIKTEDIEGFEDTSQAILIATQGIFKVFHFFYHEKFKNSLFILTFKFLKINRNLFILEGR